MAFGYWYIINSKEIRWFFFFSYSFFSLLIHSMCILINNSFWKQSDLEIRWAFRVTNTKPQNTDKQLQKAVCETWILLKYDTLVLQSFIHCYYGLFLFYSSRSVLINIYDILRSEAGVKSTSTPQIGVISKFSDLYPTYWLGLGFKSLTSLDVDLRMCETVIYFRIGRRFENLKRDIDLRYGCL
jgi:hypothetical protein